MTDTQDAWNALDGDTQDFLIQLCDYSPDDWILQMRNELADSIYTAEQCNALMDACSDALVSRLHPAQDWKFSAGQLIYRLTTFDVRRTEWHRCVYNVVENMVAGDTYRLEVVGALSDRSTGAQIPLNKIRFVDHVTADAEMGLVFLRHCGGWQVTLSDGTVDGESCDRKYVEFTTDIYADGETIQCTGCKNRAKKHLWTVEKRLADAAMLQRAGDKLAERKQARLERNNPVPVAVPVGGGVERKREPRVVETIKPLVQRRK